MKCPFLLWTFVIVQAGFPKKFCDIHADDLTKHCYLKETLVSLAHSPNQLVVDKSTNTLYFSFDFGQGEYVPAVLKLDQRQLTVLRGVRDAFAIAYDEVHKEVYFGGSHGIYKYDPARKDLRRLAMANLDIWWLFVKRRVHFIKFPSLNAYYYENRTIRHVPQLRGKMIHQFVFDHNDNIFFINTTGLFGVRNDSDQAVLLRDSPRFLGMALDNKGQIYVCSDDAIYVISRMMPKVKRVVNIQGVLGLTFDRQNNIIYSNSHELVRLLFVSSSSYYDTKSNIQIKN